MKAAVDTRELETKVKDMYRHVAEQPQGEYHLELGRPLAIRLGYTTDILDRVPDVACRVVRLCRPLLRPRRTFRGGAQARHGAAHAPRDPRRR